MGGVQLAKVTKRFENGPAVVHQVDLEIRDKEFVVLVGPSGCGKSTTLRMIAGLEEISEGTISIDGAVVNDVPPKDRDIAMVFQNYALYPHMTVYENLAFGLKMRKYAKQDIDTRVRQASEILGIQDLLGRKPKALSGGQRQRVALGRAIVRRPKVFLFDEPLSNLDANLRVQMRTEISRLHKQLQTTMIYVTHDQIEAMSMGDRIVVMHKGVVQQVDSPLAIYNAPANEFVAGFIGSPTMNFFRGTLVNGDNLIFEERSHAFRMELSPASRARLAPHAAKSVTLGIRPEHISPKAQHSGSNKLTSNVEVVEPVGNEIFVYFRMASIAEQFVCRIPSDIFLAAGGTCGLFFDPSKFHFFDGETGRAL